MVPVLSSALNSLALSLDGTLKINRSQDNRAIYAPPCWNALLLNIEDLAQVDMGGPVAEGSEAMRGSRGVLSVPVPLAYVACASRKDVSVMFLNEI